MTSRRRFLLAAPQWASLTTAFGAARAADAATAAPAGSTPPASEGMLLLEDSRNGVARDYFHYTLRVPWRGAFTGGLLGSVAVASSGRFSIVLSEPSEHVVLKRVGAWVNMASRESGRGARLDVRYRDGSSGSLACVADATIDPSAAQPQGWDVRLALGIGVLRFERPLKPVASATLVGEIASSGGPARIEAYAFISPLLPEPAVQYGLRARGLSGASLIHQTDFSKPNWWHPWFTQVSVKPSAAQLPMVDRDLDTGVPLGRTAYCVQVAAPGETPAPISAGALPESPAFMFPANIGRELDEVYFQYRLRFGEGWRGGSTQSGKLPGIASDTTRAGNGGGTSNGRNGWSFRGLFVGEPMDPGSPYNARHGSIPIGWYTYNPDQMAAGQLYGLHVPWTGRGLLGLLEVGKDYWIDQYVKVNTPGQRDGIVRAWINGKLAYERTDHVMRGLPPYEVPGQLGIQKVWMTFLHGGDRLPLPTRTLRTYWSDWTIAREYIGPPASGDNVPPRVSLVAPAAGAGFALGSVIDVVAQADDPDGSIVKVEFYCDSLLKATIAQAPFRCSVAGLARGSHTLLALAYDDRGVTSASAPLAVLVGAAAGSGVNRPPSVTVIAPAAGAVLAAGRPVDLQAAVDDPDGVVARVDFVVDGVRVATVPALRGSAVARLDDVSPGAHQVVVHVFDDRGATVASAPVAFHIGNVGQAGATGLATVRMTAGMDRYSGFRATYLSRWNVDQNFAARAHLLDGASYACLFRFAILRSEGGPVPDGATIASARLMLYKSSLYPAAERLDRLLVPWVEHEADWRGPRLGARWRAPGAGAPGADYSEDAAATASVGHAPGWLTFDVTSLVAAIARGAPNHGWRMRSMWFDANERQFASGLHPNGSLRPTLEVAYKAPA